MHLDEFPAKLRVDQVGQRSTCAGSQSSSATSRANAVTAVIVDATVLAVLPAAKRAATTFVLRGIDSTPRNRLYWV